MLTNLMSDSHADGMVRLTVSGDGVGFVRGPGADSIGVGLLNMRKGLSQLNGTLEIDSQCGCETSIRAEVPFRSA